MVPLPSILRTGSTGNGIGQYSRSFGTIGRRNRVQWAEEMMLLSPLALRMIKAGLNAELDGQAGIQELAGDATLLYYLTDEAQEGKNAFLEKRKPNFKQYPKFP